MNFPISAIARLIWAIICLFVSKNRGRSPLLGFFLGFAFGLFALIGYLIAGDKKKTARTTNIAKSNETPIEKKDFAHNEPKKESIDNNDSAFKQVVSCEPTISTTVNTVPEPQHVAETTDQFIEAEDYILSLDKKTLIKGKDRAKIVVPEGVEIIAERAFMNLENINEVILPNTLKEIGDFAFLSSSVEKVNLPGGITILGSCIFFGCNRLKHIKFDEGIKQMGVEMFSHCENLFDIELPHTLQSIPDSSFAYCSCLSKIIIPYGVRHLGNDCFLGCMSLCDIELSNSIEFIGIYAFSSCWGLKEIVLPNSLVGISAFTFNDNPELCDVKLPNNLTCIMNNAFGGCNHLKMKLPQSITYIDSNAFSNCNELELSVPQEKQEWFSSNCDCYRNLITGYKTDNDYVITPDIQKKTERFMKTHQTIVEILKERRETELNEMMGMRPEDEFEYYPFEFSDGDIDL